jgi:hypothetical protein
VRTLIVEDVMRSVKVNERSNIIGDPGVRDSSAWDKASRKTYWRKNLATICFNIFAKANTRHELCIGTHTQLQLYACTSSLSHGCLCVHSQLFKRTPLALAAPVRAHTTIPALRHEH